MALISQQRIAAFLQRGDTATTNTEKGRALEDLICYLFPKVPGVSVWRRNELDAFGNEEFDVLFWNKGKANGLYFFPATFLAECKNSANPVGSRDIVNFISTLKSRGCDHGILVAAYGITGTSSPPTHSYNQIAVALRERIKILPITRENIISLRTSDDLVELLKLRLCGLAWKGTAV